MASIYTRVSGIYQIAFSKTVNGKSYQAKFSLHTKSKRTALKKKIEFEELYEKGEIDPFSGWSPKLHNRDASSTNQSLALASLSEKFLKQRSQLAKKTLINYEDILFRLQKQVGSSLPVTLINESDIRDFCFKKDLKSASKANYLRHLKVFFNWLLNQGYVKKNVTKNIQKPKVKSNISDKIISKEDLNSIFAVFDKDMREKEASGAIKRDFQRRRWFKPVIRLAFYSGLRLKEVVNLEWKRVDLDRKTIIVTDSKNGEERTVPILRELVKSLRAWKKLNASVCHGLVFPSEKAHYEGTKMSEDNVSAVYRKYVKKAGLKHNFHGLRHTCCTNFLIMGYSINEVALMMGHSSLEVTRIYEHLTATDLMKKTAQLESNSRTSREKNIEEEKEKQKMQDKIDKLEKELARLKSQ